MTNGKRRDAIEQIEFMRNLLAFLLVGSFVGSLTILLFHTLAKDNEQLVTYMLGQISGMATTALGFYFVSKVGADALDAKRADNTGKLADAVVAAAAAGTTDQPAAEAKIAGAQEATDAAQDKVDDLKDNSPKKEPKT